MLFPRKDALTPLVHDLLEAFRQPIPHEVSQARRLSAAPFELRQPLVQRIPLMLQLLYLCIETCRCRTSRRNALTESLVLISVGFRLRSNRLTSRNCQLKGLVIQSREARG